MKIVAELSKAEAFTLSPETFYDAWIKPALNVAKEAHKNFPAEPITIELNLK